MSTQRSFLTEGGETVTVPASHGHEFTDRCGDCGGPICDECGEHEDERCVPFDEIDFLGDRMDEDWR